MLDRLAITKITLAVLIQNMDAFNKEYNAGHSHVIRVVPLKLLPLNERHYTSTWAKDNYRYRHLFNRSVTCESYNTEDDLQEWIFEAMKLTKEIKNIGIAFGRSEIVNIAREHYGMTMPNTSNCKPSNIDDVMTIIEDETWYNENTTYKQNIIYHLIYGLTRSGMNGWMLQQEQQWLNKYNIKYNEDEVGIRKTKLRGFVYSIMNSKFSNSTIKLFRTVMQRKHGEFITVRKPAKNLSSNFVYTARNFLSSSGYVVTCKDVQDHLETATNECVEKAGKMFISLCKKKNMNLIDIHVMLDDLYNIPNESKDEVCSTMSSFDNNNEDDEEDSVNQFIGQKESNEGVAKEPRIVSTHWLAGKTDICTGMLLSTIAIIEHIFLFLNLYVFKHYRFILL